MFHIEKAMGRTVRICNYPDRASGVSNSAAVPDRPMDSEEDE
jgi:hypothetical protein